MKIILTILFIIISKNVISQDSLYWQTVSFDAGVKNYEVQSSMDAKNWTTLTTVNPKKQKDSNVYTYPLQTVNLWYRIVSNMHSSVYISDSLLYASVLPLSIINYGVTPAQKYCTVYWTSVNESNINNYEIDRSFNGTTFDNVAELKPKGNSRYSVSITRPVNTTVSCGIVILGMCLFKKTTTTIDTRKGIYNVTYINTDGRKILLATLKE